MFLLGREDAMAGISGRLHDYKVNALLERTHVLIKFSEQDGPFFEMMICARVCTRRARRGGHIACPAGGVCKYIHHYHQSVTIFAQISLIS